MSKDIKTKFRKANIKVAKKGQSIMTFNESNVQKIEILEAIDGQATINGKLRDIYKMKVLDINTDKEMLFNPAAKGLMEQLYAINENEGLIGQKLRIEKIGSGTATIYKVDKLI